MSSAYAEDAWELLLEAANLPHGPGKIALHEQAITLADTHHDDPLGFDLRMETLWPLYHAKRADLLLVHFSWCLAYLDRTPAVPAFDLLWQYRWVVDSLPGFADISRDQIEAAWADLRDRYIAAGWSVRPAYLLRRRICMKMGDAAAAKAAHREYTKAPRDQMSDGPDTDITFSVDYLGFLRQDAATLRAAGPFFDGSLDDAHHTVHFVDDVLPTLIRRRLFGEARDWQRRSARLVESRPQFLGVSHNSLVLLSVVGDHAGAVRFFDKNFGPALAHPGQLTHVGMMQAALFFARRLLAANKLYLSLKVQDAPVPGATAGRVRPGPLVDWLETALPALCRLADARNGTPHFVDRLNDLDEWAAAAADYTNTQR